ncbi:protein FAM107B [Solea solea]|uniref:protein FAM107B n=1 Tax=Solea solea TaxID=90069 RepID=UPI00272BC37F|nr:protein FAM107B [Solea solea]
MSLNGSLPNNDNPAHMDVPVAPSYRMINTTQTNNHRKGKEVQAEARSGHSTPVKSLRTHNELHKELLLTHKKGLALSSRSELQQVLERRKRVQSDQVDEGQSRTPLEDVLLRRQQKQLEKEKKHGEKEQEEAQLMEFVRVRQNLRKIHSVMQNKAGNL